jgi:tRNA-splicing ligase RtcB
MVVASASHGAGRRMSRTKAREQFNWSQWKAVLKQREVRLLSAGLDEVPGAYKDIRKVMAEQTDLVDIVAQFDPKIVKMSDDGKSED